MTVLARIRKCTAIALMAAVPAIAAATQLQHMSDVKEVRKHVGETTRICGQVTTYDYPGKDGSGDCTLRLDIGEPNWKPVFYVLLTPEPGDVPVADPYLGQQVCVNGRIQSDSHRIPFVAIQGAAGLDVQNSVAALSPLLDGAVQSCEVGVVTPKLTKEVRPNYPRDEFLVRARNRDHSTQTVFLQAAVDETGQVKAYRAIYSPSQSFSAEAETALKQWRFKPATRNGKAIAMIVQVVMTFTWG